jgi:hypothetical protein
LFEHLKITNINMKTEIAKQVNNQERITIEMSDGSRCTIKVFYDKNRITVNTENKLIIEPHVSNEVDIYYLL